MTCGILVPGRDYSTDGTLFDLAAFCFAARGRATEHVTWTVPDGLPGASHEPFVRAHTEAALARAETHSSGSPFVVAKSLGSYSAALVAERGLPAIWLTPVLTEPSIVAAIAASPAPALLIGGTRDRLWSGDLATSTGKQVLSIPAADHGLEPDGPIAAYTSILTDVAQAIDTFLTTHAPPH
ncbi:MAG: hypothetical protein QOJ50_2364 [Cryptosporangiaceae bacterium]|nr:hypothetical protein [Cryptosporangiaceae bacterium]